MKASNTQVVQSGKYLMNKKLNVAVAVGDGVKGLLGVEVDAAFGTQRHLILFRIEF